uniref:Uncharacterized protein n=1 Tax=Brassica campestris TaxID=3711 RepID=A0A3P5XXW0_BRACM|nr:unnamed protein product [Brassica rapa]
MFSSLRMMMRMKMKITKAIQGNLIFISFPREATFLKSRTFQRKSSKQRLLVLD